MCSVTLFKSQMPLVITLDHCCRMMSIEQFYILLMILLQEAQCVNITATTTPLLLLCKLDSLPSFPIHLPIPGSL